MKAHNPKRGPAQHIDLPLFAFAEALENYPAQKPRPVPAVNHLRQSRGLSYAHAKVIAELHFGISEVYNERA